MKNNRRGFVQKLGDTIAERFYNIKQKMLNLSIRTGTSSAIDKTKRTALTYKEYIHYRMQDNMSEIMD